MAGFPYTDETGRRINPKPITFQVIWYGPGAESDKPGLRTVSSVEEIRRVDLTAAITYACNTLKASRGHARNAHGFFVQSKREES